ncbi:hypothetical protein [Streptomyces sp. NPDC001450]
MPASDPIAPPRVLPFAEHAARPSRGPSAQDAALSLDQLAAERTETLPGPFHYQLKGVRFTLPALHGLPLDVWERVRGGTDPVASLRAVVGEQKTREMAAAGFTLCDLDVIVEDWERRSGVRR